MKELIHIAEMWLLVLGGALSIYIISRRLRKENEQLVTIIASDDKAKFLVGLGEFLLEQKKRNVFTKHAIYEGKESTDIERYKYFHYYYLTKLKMNEINNAKIVKWVVPLMYSLLLFPFLYFLKGVSAKTILVVFNGLIAFCLLIIFIRHDFNNNRRMMSERDKLLETIDERLEDMVRRN